MANIKRNRYILGFNYNHGISYCLVNQDGDIEIAIEEERYNREKNTFRFTFIGILEYFKKKGISLSQIDYLYMTWSMGNKGLKKALKKMGEAHAEEDGNNGKKLFSFNNFYDRNSSIYKKGLLDFVKLSNFLRKLRRACPVIWLPHHKAHAASAYYTSGYDFAAVLIIDGCGELETVSIWKGKDGSLEQIFKEVVPHSIGLVWMMFSVYLNLEEGKIMGLSTYGTKRYESLFYERIMHRDEDGNFRVKLPLSLFAERGYEFIRSFLSEIFNRQARKHEQPVEQFHADVAASLQSVTETFFLHYTKLAKSLTGEKNICLAGGCIQNCVANQRVIEKNIFQNVYIQPAAHDAGTAIGAALWGYFDKWRGNKKYNPDCHKLENVYLGESFDNHEIEKLLKKFKFDYSTVPIPSDIVEQISSGNVIGLFQGQAEFGPRALGNRSIIASPVHSFMKYQVNSIKKREFWRPFAPSVIENEAERYFEGCTYSPFMIVNYNVRPHTGNGLSFTHVDNTARVQTVNRTQNPYLYSLLEEIKKKTGLPIILNTSFNLQGEPIVNHPLEALRDYLISDLNGLILNKFFLRNKSNFHSQILNALNEEKSIALLNSFIQRHKDVMVVDDSDIHPHVAGLIKNTIVLLKWMGANIVSDNKKMKGIISFNFFNSSELSDEVPLLFFDGDLWWLLEPEEIKLLRNLLVDDLKRRTSGKSVYIWGTSSIGQWAKRAMTKMGFKNIYFIDSKNNNLHNIDYVSSETIPDLENPYFIIASHAYRSFMSEQLREFGFEEQKDFQYSIFKDFSMFLDSHEITMRAVEYAGKGGKGK